MMFGLNSKLNSESSMSQAKQTESDMKFGENHSPGPPLHVGAFQPNINKPFSGIDVTKCDLVMKDIPHIKTVEWEMLDKRKFFPLSMMSSFTVRCFLYPLTLIRTRLQVQKGKEVYSGTFDAGRKILQTEGIRGLYRGFFISAAQIVSGLAYVSTYENVRHTLEKNNVTNSKVKAFVGGCCASIVGQTIIVPFDVISQHVMLIGLAENRTGETNVKTHSRFSQFVKGSTAMNKKGVSKTTAGTAVTANKILDLSYVNQLGIQTEGRSRGQIAKDITMAIYHKDGMKGYYRGYMAAICTYVPSSASWWTFYQIFQDTAGAIIPAQDLGIPNTVIQCAAAMSSGCATALMTNPLDLTKTRVQVQRRPFVETALKLWREERLRIFTKGLSARMTSSVIYSVAIIFGYETVKKWSVLEEYKYKVLW